MKVTVHVEHDPGAGKSSSKKGSAPAASPSPAPSSPGGMRPTGGVPPLPQSTAGTAQRPMVQGKQTPSSSASSPSTKQRAQPGKVSSSAKPGSTSSSKKPTQKSGSVTSAKAGGTNPNGKAGTTKTRTPASQPALPRQAVAGPLLGTRGPMTTSGSGAAPLASDPGNPPSNQLNQQTAAQPVGSQIPPTPPKEPKPTNQTSAMRGRQTQVLRARQNRELAGQTSGAPRDVDAGAGFWPPLSPLL